MNTNAIFRYLTAGLLLAGGLSAATPPTAFAAARFLTQAGWGANAASIAEVQSLGFSAWIDAQVNAPESAIPDVAVGQDSKGNPTYSIRPVQDAFFYNAATGKDQLRQRVAFALGQIWVVSGVKLDVRAIPPYLRILQKDAFSNYYTIMYDVTKSPAMGHYLDMVNNNKPTATHGANENYAREILQLFTIGLSELNDNGTVRTSGGVPIPSYNQDQIEGFSRAFTGWTYAPIGTASSHFGNPANWTAPMVSFQANHDVATKLVLGGVTLPANQTAERDLDDALNNIFHNHNMAPFICRQLIQRLVTSDPSPAYVARIAAVFNNATDRGDMKAVVKAILLDSEARKGDDGSNPAAAKLTEPILFLSKLVRGLNGAVAPINPASFSSTNRLTDYANGLGQNPFYPPTVFNYFLPGYRVHDAQTGVTANAPEFQLLSEATAIGRVDFVNSLAFGTVGGINVSAAFTQFETILGATPTPATEGKMVDAVYTSLTGAAPSAPIHNAILTAVEAAATPKAKVATAIYLTASSWQYQVQQ